MLLAIVALGLEGNRVDDLASKLHNAGCIGSCNRWPSRFASNSRARYIT